MNKTKTSLIWKIPKDELENIVKNSTTFKSILKHFNLINKGSNSKTLKKRLQEDNIDYSHIKIGRNLNKQKPLIDILIENSNVNRLTIKNRLIRENILKNKCYICGLDNNWNDKLLIMVLDHINGIYNDNRLENLRLLCPNCNSQTDTFCGKNNKKENYDCYYKCGNKVCKTQRVCEQCKNKNKKIVEKPTKDELKKQVDELGCVCVSRMYKVSHTTIRRWIKD